MQPDEFSNWPFAGYSPLDTMSGIPTEDALMPFQLSSPLPSYIEEVVFYNNEPRAVVSVGAWNYLQEEGVNSLVWSDADDTRYMSGAVLYSATENFFIGAPSPGSDNPYRWRGSPFYNIHAMWLHDTQQDVALYYHDGVYGTELSVYGKNAITAYDTDLYQKYLRVTDPLLLQNDW